MTAYTLDRTHNAGEAAREARLAQMTPTSRTVEWGRDVWMLVVADALEWAGFTEAVAYNVPGTDKRRYELLGYDSPGEYVYEFDRVLLGRHTLDDLCIDVVWFIRRAAARHGKDYRKWPTSSSVSTS